MRKAAKEADLILDDDDDDFSQQKSPKNQANVNRLQSQLDALLRQSLIPRGLSMKYVASGNRLGLASEFLHNLNDGKNMPWLKNTTALVDAHKTKK